MFQRFIVSCFQFAIWAPWKMMFTKHLFDKKWMMMDIIDKNVFEIICYLLARFKTINLCSVHFIRFVNIFFLRKYGSWKLQLESWNTNHKSLNRTLHLCSFIFLISLAVFDVNLWICEIFDVLMWIFELLFILFLKLRIILRMLLFQSVDQKSICLFLKKEWQY